MDLSSQPGGSSSSLSVSSIPAYLRAAIAASQLSSKITYSTSQWQLSDSKFTLQYSCRTTSANRTWRHAASEWELRMEFLNGRGLAAWTRLIGQLQWVQIQTFLFYLVSCINVSGVGPAAHISCIFIIHLKKKIKQIYFATFYIYLYVTYTLL